MMPTEAKRKMLRSSKGYRRGKIVAATEFVRPRRRKTAQPPAAEKSRSASTPSPRTRELRRNQRFRRARSSSSSDPRTLPVSATRRREVFFARSTRFFFPLLQWELKKGNNSAKSVLSHGTAPAGCNGCAEAKSGPAPTVKIKADSSSRNGAQHSQIHFCSCFHGAVSRVPWQQKTVENADISSHSQQLFFI